MFDQQDNRSKRPFYSEGNSTNQTSAAQKVHSNIQKMYLAGKKDHPSDLAKIVLKPMEENLEHAFTPLDQVKDEFFQKTIKLTSYLQETLEELNTVNFVDPTYVQSFENSLTQTLQKFNYDFMQKAQTSLTEANRSQTVEQTPRRSNNSSQIQQDVLPVQKIVQSVQGKDLLDFKIEDLTQTVKSLNDNKTKVQDGTLWNDQESIKNALREELTKKKFGKAQTQAFIQEVFSDTLQIDSIFMTAGHLNLSSKEQDISNHPKAELKWYEVPNFKPSKDSKQISEIDFFRDLGPLQRANLHEQYYNKQREKYLAQMSQDDRRDHKQLILNLLYGITSIEKLHEIILSKEHRQQIRSAAQKKQAEKEKLEKTNLEKNRSDDRKSMMIQQQLSVIEEEMSVIPPKRKQTMERLSSTEIAIKETTEHPRQSIVIPIISQVSPKKEWLQQQLKQQSNTESSYSDNDAQQQTMTTETLMQQLNDVSESSLENQHDNTNKHSSTTIDNEEFLEEQKEEKQMQQSDSQVTPTRDIKINSRKFLHESVGNSKKELKQQPLKPVELSPRSKARENRKKQQQLKIESQSCIEMIKKLWIKIEAVQLELVNISSITPVSKTSNIKPAEFQKSNFMKNQEQMFKKPEQVVQVSTTISDSTKRVLTRKLEKYVLKATEIFDNIERIKKEMIGDKVEYLHEISEQMSVFLQKGTSIDRQEINEEIKQKFISRLVREYRHYIEVQRQKRIKMHNKMSMLGKKDLPSLSPSPDKWYLSTTSKRSLLLKSGKSQSRSPSPTKWYMTSTSKRSQDRESKKSTSPGFDSKRIESQSLSPSDVMPQHRMSPAKSKKLYQTKQAIGLVPYKRTPEPRITQQQRS